MINAIEVYANPDKSNFNSFSSYDNDKKGFTPKTHPFFSKSLGSFLFE